MALFRPLNSSESNLFTIRACITAHTSGDTTLIDNDSSTSVDTFLTSPTINNLPSNFRITYNNTNPHYELEFGKVFTSRPSVFITPVAVASSGNVTETDTTDPLIPVIEFVTLTSGTTNIKFSFKDIATGVPTLAANGFDIMITGPVKLGQTSGNSNKGWATGAGNNPANVYSFMDVGVGTGNPHASSLTLNSALVGVPDTVKTGSLAISIETMVTFINADGEITLTIANGYNGQIKHLVCIAATNTATLSANLNTTTTLTAGISFNEAGQSATLIYDTETTQWSLIGQHDITFTA